MDAARPSDPRLDRGQTLLLWGLLALPAYLATYDAAARFSTPEPGRVGLLALGLAAGFAVLCRRSPGLAVVGLASSLFSLGQVLTHSGWPANHEILSWKHRTQMYLLHLQQGDWAPLWSSTDLFGQGSPMPAFYHKAFYYLSSLLYWLSGGVKMAMVLAVLCLLLVGCLGMHRCLRRMGVPEAAAVCLGSALPLASYTMTNWLARGGFAEFSAAMIVPWFLDWLLRWVREERFGWDAAPVLLLLYWSHSIVAFYSVALAALALPLFLAPGARTLRDKARDLLVRGGVSAAAFGVALAPWLYVMRKLGAVYSVGAMTEAFDVLGQFRPLGRWLPLGRLQRGRHGPD